MTARRIPPAVPPAIAAIGSDAVAGACEIDAVGGGPENRVVVTTTGPSPVVAEGSPLGSRDEGDECRRELDAFADIWALMTRRWCVALDNVQGRTPDRGRKEKLIPPTKYGEYLGTCKSPSTHVESSCDDQTCNHSCALPFEPRVLKRVLMSRGVWAVNACPVYSNIDG